MTIDPSLRSGGRGGIVFERESEIATALRGVAISLSYYPTDTCGVILSGAKELSNYLQVE